MMLTENALIIRVDGLPAAQGSKRYLGQKSGKAVVVESSKKVAPWRTDVRAAAEKAVDGSHGHLWDTPVEVVLTFGLPRPKSHYRTGRNAHMLRDAAPRRPTGPPDVDKLARAVLDALAGVVYADDKTIVSLCANKVYATRRPGCDIRVVGL